MYLLFICHFKENYLCQLITINLLTNLMDQMENINLYIHIYTVYTCAVFCGKLLLYTAILLVNCNMSAVWFAYFVFM